MTKEKTIEETYQKLSQREHVLKRSGVYIGDIKKNTEELWVNSTGDNKMIKQFIEYSPGFMKIFDEVLSNATDHAIRDTTVTKIEVTYSKDTGEISVYNNGSGVPVVLHKEQNIYVPELIFGHLLSGSNYNDNDTRTTVGVNGMGIKLTNIFSKKFVVETVDSENKKKFIQEFSNNMLDKTKPKITSAANTKSYTKITFIPDYTRFSMENLEDDTILLIKKRVYDCIANTKSHVNLYLNGEKIKGKSFTDYIKYYFDDSKIISECCIQTIKGTEFIWEYAIVPSDHYEQVSFVNGNCTYLGGKHVDYILYQIINKIKELLETKKKLKDVKPNFIKDKFCLFLKATIINPSFNSQTKETLTTQVKDFGCKVEVTDTFINKIYKSSIIDEIVEFCKLKESSNLAKTSDGKKVSKVYIPKLEDAIYAGTAKSDQCTLILTEGDSAKTFAMWGRAIIGPEKYGVFPLKGKLLNVRDATISQLINNEEINNIKQILGLKEKKVYTDTKELRYNRIMLLTDADVDGSHIKALVMNFIHSGWPSLLKMKSNFIQTLKTPIVIAIKGKDIKEFFTEQDYHIWLNSNNTKGYKINYYKGLGTSTKDDAKKLFKRFDELIVNYYHKDNKCDESILLAFDKDKNNKVKIKDTDTDVSDIVHVNCTDKRKAWLANYDKDIYIDVKENQVSYQDIINKELIHFSIYDNTRSIPSICDGLKPSQRKILYYMLHNNVNVSMKVAQLTGKISSDTSYHHGEASLEGAIVGLAQDFVGTNNINLLYPDGNHGSRLLGGKDAASARYIKTRLSDITPLIFNKLDVGLLDLLQDDGIQIEPEWYLPIIPMVLVNGCDGIGTGYSTSIPPYNPKDLINNILKVMDDKDPLPLIPYYKNFNGEIVKDPIKDNTFITKGKYIRLSDTQIKVTELPIGCWVTIYKEFLESLVETNNKKDTKSKKKFALKSVENKTADENDAICFIIEFKDASILDLLIKSNTLEKELKLTKSVNTNNMHVFSESLILTKYNNPNDILLDWYDLRLEYYQKRKDYLTKKYRDELIILKSKIRFISEYIEKIIDINKKSKDFITNLLRERKYYDQEGSYDYLLNLTIYSFTEEKIEALNKQVQNKQAELDYITNKTDKQLWKVDLEELNKYL
jgi:DNA topoisomerase-2